MLLRIIFSVLVIFPSFGVIAQKLKKADKAVVANLLSHIRYLADDKLEGRRAGSAGEKLAREYISGQFKAIGLQAKGTDGWMQPFEIYDGKQINHNTFLIINGAELKLEKEYFPLNCSANKGAEALVSMALAERNVPWFLDLKELLEENKDNPHFDLAEAIKTKANKSAEKGATALIVYNSSSIADNLRFNSKDRIEPASIPVLYVTSEGRKKYLADSQSSLDVKLKTDIGDRKRTGHNVVGYIDNGAATTIVLGAHYDHLGYGEDGNSMLRGTTDKQIHNGADDNASGTAALIELARLLKHSKTKTNNYLFLAFSAEELGLNGSKFFTEHPTIDFLKVSYMINMDMVGRLNDSSKTLQIGGYGTSPWWGQLFGKMSNKKYFTIKYDSSGTGPSDHTSFYRKDIPVLFFFTGLHSDYHKPTDDFDKINYTGELQVVKLITWVIEESGKQNKLAFTKTRETQTTSTARLGSATMGIMPDYTFSGTGVRVDGVTDNRPAQKAGLKAGDIIVQLGEYNTNSMENYMQALSKFKKGDKTKVKYKRGNDVLESEVVF